MTPPLVETLIEDERWQELDLESLAETAARAVLVHRGLEPDGFEVGLLAGNDERIAALNTAFRGRAEATNVLSWPAQEHGNQADGMMPPAPEPGTPDAPAPLGDIALAWETCAREAHQAGRPMADHVSHLLVHAVLHLLGHDHMRDGDAALMESIEVQVLALMGVSNPYETDGTQGHG